MFFDKETEMNNTKTFDEGKLAEMEEYIKNPEATSIFIPVNIETLFQNALFSSSGHLSRVQDLIDNMSKHPEFTMRLFVVKELPRLASLCLVEEIYQYVTNRLCLTLIDCLNDKNEEVRKACEISLIVLMKGVSPKREAIYERICPLVTEMCKTNCYGNTVAPALMSGVRKKLTAANRYNDQRHRMSILEPMELISRWRGSQPRLRSQSGWEYVVIEYVISQPALMSGSLLTTAENTQLLGKLAPLVGKEATEKHFLNVLIKLCEHNLFNIRKNCVKSLADFSVVLGTEITEKFLLNVFVKLCRDECWEVRACCPEAFIPIACTCSSTTRKTILANNFAQLLKDSKPCIRMCSYAFLGAFICTFAEPSVTKLEYDEKGELVLVGQDGQEFRMGTVHVNYLRNAQISEDNKEDQFTGKDRKGGQALMAVSKALQYFVQNDTGQLNLRCLNTGQSYIPSGNQLSLKCPWTSRESNNLWNNSWTSMDEQEADEMYNAFRFWRTPPCELDAFGSESEQENIRTNLKILDSELIYLSEKLAKCSTEDLEEIKSDSLISSASSSDSGWNSAETTPRRYTENMPSSNTEMFGSEIHSQRQANDSSVVTSSDQSEIVPKILLDSFLSITSPLQEEMFDKELAQDCAYCLPAIVLILGPSKWPYIKNAYKCLSMNIQWRVRKTIVSGIHKLAMLVGEEIASKDLAPIFESFIRDLDEVKIGALEHLADFLRLVQPATRNAFLPWLKDFLETEFDFNWRYREEFGEQLKLLIELYSPPDWLKYFKPLTVLLLCDKVAAVRSKAVSLFLELLKNLSGEAEYRKQLLWELTEFPVHSSWRTRQVFVYVCSEIAREKALDQTEFCRFLLEPLLMLSKDPIPNVGLCVARCLASDIISSGFIDSSSPQYDTILETLKKLKSALDRDIRYFAHQSEKDQEEEEGMFNEEEVRIEKKETENTTIMEKESKSNDTVESDCDENHYQSQGDI